MNTWTDNDVQRYIQWYETPKGAYALRMEQKLLSHLISAWPRRNQRLLEVGCGPGHFLDFFWRAGFDITGLDSAPAMIRAAEFRVGRKADLHIGQAAHLPFDDKEFDFVALLTLLEFTEEPEPILIEAARVARKGILISYLNRFSFYYLGSGLPLPLLQASLLRRIHWFTPLSLCGLLSRTLPQAELRTRSCLPGPMWSWNATGFGRLLNSFLLPSYLGSYCATRAMLIPDKPLTPLLSMTREQRCS